MKSLMRKPFSGSLMPQFWDSWFDRFFEDGFSRDLQLAAWSPRVDVFDKDGYWTVKADLPGLDEKNLDVQVQNGVLTISGKRQEEHEEKKDGFYRMERSTGSFSRSIALPEGADAAKITADYQKGVLTVTMPHPESDKNKPLKIPVKAAS